jgi:hypothetical protein
MPNMREKVQTLGRIHLGSHDDSGQITSYPEMNKYKEESPTIH